MSKKCGTWIEREEHRIKKRIAKGKALSGVQKMLIKSKHRAPKCGIKVVVNGKVLSESNANNSKELREFAIKLNVTIPKSEIWFRALYEPFRDSLVIKNKGNRFNQNKPTKIKDRYNIPIFGFIPDVLNKRFKYIIEVDGSIHQNPEVQQRDRAKEALYINRGYKVFRIKAYDNESFNQFVSDYLKFLDYYLR